MHMINSWFSLHLAADAELKPSVFFEFSKWTNDSGYIWKYKWRFLNYDVVKIINQLF